MPTTSAPVGRRPDLLAPSDPEPGFWALVADAGRVDAERRAELALAFEALRSRGPLFRLATCHRVEIYGRGAPVEGPWLEEAAGPRLLVGRDAVRHLLRVAAGLESAVIGEDQILSQLRGAARSMRAFGDLDPVLDRLVQAALGVGRRVRRGPRRRERGLADRALGWLEGRLGRPTGVRILVVGAGPMGAAAARAAEQRGARVTLATRSPRSSIDGTAPIDLAAAADLAPRVDGIVVALAGPWLALERARPDELPPIVDLSSPGAVPGSTRAALGRGFIGIDALYERRAPDAAFEQRAAAEISMAERDFLTWLAARPSAASAQRLVERTARRRERRVERTLRRLPDLDQRSRMLVRQLAAQVEADLLHEPLARLRADADGSARAAALELFDL